MTSPRVTTSFKSSVNRKPIDTVQHSIGWKYPPIPRAKILLAIEHDIPVSPVARAPPLHQKTQPYHHQSPRQAQSRATPLPHPVRLTRNAPLVRRTQSASPIKIDKRSYRRRRKLVEARASTLVSREMIPQLNPRRHPKVLLNHPIGLKTTLGYQRSSQQTSLQPLLVLLGLLHILIVLFASLRSTRLNGHGLVLLPSP